MKNAAEEFYLILYTLQGVNLHWNLNIAILLMKNAPNFNSANYKIPKDLLMMAYTN